MTTLSADNIDAVVKHLPILSRAGLKLAEWKGETTPDGTSTLPWEDKTGEVDALITDLYENGFVVEFDWPAWQESAERFVNEPTLLKQASLEELRKLLTTHLRKDRFCEGHFTSMIECGHIAAVLARLNEIGEEKRHLGLSGRA